MRAHFGPDSVRFIQCSTSSRSPMASEWRQKLELSLEKNKKLPYGKVMGHKLQICIVCPLDCCAIMHACARLYAMRMQRDREKLRSRPSTKFVSVILQYYQLATLRPDGRPANRTVVHRGFYGDNGITIVTDHRSVPDQATHVSRIGRLIRHVPNAAEGCRVRLRRFLGCAVCECQNETANSYESFGGCVVQE